MPRTVDVDPRLLADLNGRRALSSRILARLAWSGVMTDHSGRSGERWSAPQFFWWRRRSPEQLMLERRHARWLAALHARRALASAAALRARAPVARPGAVVYAPAGASAPPPSVVVPNAESAASVAGVPETSDVAAVPTPRGAIAAGGGAAATSGGAAAASTVTPTTRAATVSTEVAATSGAAAASGGVAERDHASASTRDVAAPSSTLGSPVMAPRFPANVWERLRTVFAPRRASTVPSVAAEPMVVPPTAVEPITPDVAHARSDVAAVAQQQQHDEVVSEGPAAAPEAVSAREDLAATEPEAAVPADAERADKAEPEAAVPADAERADEAEPEAAIPADAELADEAEPEAQALTPRSAFEVVAPIAAAVFHRQSVAPGASALSTELAERRQASPARLFWWPDLKLTVPRPAPLPVVEQAFSRPLVVVGRPVPLAARPPQGPQQDSPPTEARGTATEGVSLPPVSAPRGAVRVVYEGVYVGRRNRRLRSIEASRSEVSTSVAESQTEGSPVFVPGPPSPLPPPAEPGLAGVTNLHHYIAGAQEERREAMLSPMLRTEAFARDQVVSADDMKIRPTATVFSSAAAEAESELEIASPAEPGGIARVAFSLAPAGRGAAPSERAPDTRAVGPLVSPATAPTPVETVAPTGTWRVTAPVTAVATTRLVSTTPGQAATTQPISESQAASTAEEDALAAVIARLPPAMAAQAIEAGALRGRALQPVTVAAPEPGTPPAQMTQAELWHLIRRQQRRDVPVAGPEPTTNEPHAASQVSVEPAHADGMASSRAEAVPVAPRAEVVASGRAEVVASVRAEVAASVRAEVAASGRAEGAAPRAAIVFAPSSGGGRGATSSSASTAAQSSSGGGSDYGSQSPSVASTSGYTTGESVSGGGRGSSMSIQRAIDDEPGTAGGVPGENVDDQATAQNNINTEQLAEEVFNRLRWRLSIERDRTFG